MRFHVVSLPHTQVTEAFSACAYTEKVRKFCIMMKQLRGHEVILYAGEENDAPVDELVTCISEADRAAVVGDKHYVQAPFEPSLDHWRRFNHRAANAIRKRAHLDDFVCVIGGRSHEQIAKALPGIRVVEFGIGYGGTFSQWRVFESYAWMHVVYGAHGGQNPNAAKGDKWFDDVIPGYIEPEKFPFSAEKDDYLLLVGRMGAGKGERVAVDVARHMGLKLITAGQGEPPKGDHIEHRGVVNAAERGILMSRARALLAPTEYIEPFGNVVVEAQACGTPTITTDWGAFTETNINGVTGYRCRHLREFVLAVENAQSLPRLPIRERAIETYGLEAISRRYEAYFRRIETLNGKGWYEMPSETEARLADAA